MVGERHRRIFAIGDRVVIRVDKVNTITDEIDFHLVTDDEEHGELQRKKSGPARRKNDVAERSSLSEKRSRRSKRRRKNSGKKKERSIGEVLPADASAGESGKENGNSLARKNRRKKRRKPAQKRPRLCEEAALSLREAGSGEENICETPHRKKESIPKERSDLSVCSLLLLHDDWMIYDCDKPIEADADNRFFFLRKIIFRREKLNFFSSFAVMFLCSVPAKRPEARCDLN